MAVLGITAAGLMSLHVGAVRGIAESGSISLAMDLANQRVEELSTEGDVALAARGCPAALVGCGLDRPNPEAAMAACSGRAGAGTVPDAANVPSNTGNKYRFDTQVTPLAGAQAGGQLVTVSVCWREVSGVVRRVQSRRIVAPRSRGGA